MADNDLDFTSLYYILPSGSDSKKQRAVIEEFMSKNSFVENGLRLSYDEAMACVVLLNGGSAECPVFGRLNIEQKSNVIKLVARLQAE